MFFHRSATATGNGSKHTASARRAELQWSEQVIQLSSARFDYKFFHSPSCQSLEFSFSTENPEFSPEMNSFHFPLRARVSGLAHFGQTPRSSTKYEIVLRKVLVRFRLRRRKNFGFDTGTATSKLGMKWDKFFDKSIPHSPAARGSTIAWALLNCVWANSSGSRNNDIK